MKFSSTYFQQLDVYCVDAKRRRSETDAAADDSAPMAGPSWGELWKEYKAKQRAQVEKLVVPKKSKGKKSTLVIKINALLPHSRLICY